MQKSSKFGSQSVTSRSLLLCPMRALGFCSDIYLYYDLFLLYIIIPFHLTCIVTLPVI